MFRYTFISKPTRVSPPPPATHQLIIIDSQVNDYQNLVSTFAGDSDLLILDTASDGLSQISDYLKTLPAHTFQSIRIISHGSAGSLLLGFARSQAPAWECSFGSSSFPKRSKLELAALWFPTLRLGTSKTALSFADHLPT